MNTTIESLQALYVKLGGSLTDTYEDIAGGVPVSDYAIIPDMIAAVTKKATTGGGGITPFIVECNTTLEEGETSVSGFRPQEATYNDILGNMNQPLIIHLNVYERGEENRLIPVKKYTLPLYVEEIPTQESPNAVLKTTIQAFNDDDSDGIFAASSESLDSYPIFGIKP